MSGTDFIVQEEAVVAHLFWAMAAVEQVTVALAGRAISGRLLPPDPDRQAVVFEPNPGQDVPDRSLRKGKIVLFKYASLTDQYQFKSQLMDIEPTKWLVSIPRDIHRSDRRMVERHDVHSTRRYTIQVNKPDGTTRTLIVHDISPAGIGVGFDPKIDAFKEGQILRGSLHLLGHESFTVRFEVVTVHALANDNSQRLIGCRFVGLGFSGCERIALAMDGDTKESSV